MSFFKKILGGSKSKTPKGFFSVAVNNIESVGNGTVKVTFDIPESDKGAFQFEPGQYIVLNVEINGKSLRRSYSICSGPNEKFAVAIKKVDGGAVSTWANETLSAGDEILISKPEGSFGVPKEAKNVVLIAAGSGITPMLSILKSGTAGRSYQLFDGNRTTSDILFKNVIDGLKDVNTTYFLSREKAENTIEGRLNAETFGEVIKSDLGILKSDAFLLCGPEEMIFEVVELLKSFGVSESKIHFELFTTPTKLNQEAKPTGEAFEGTSHVQVIIDGDMDEFDMSGKGNILEKAIDEGLDAPYSCKGGVCSTCKAKVTNGKASMKLNYSLTDKEVEEGYILTCQASPCSEEITVNYDLG